MLKLILAFVAFLLLAVVIAMEGRELVLSFYVLFPFLIFPFFYFVECEARLFSGLAAVTLAILFGTYLIFHPTNEILIFGAICFGIAAVLFFYRRQWQRAFRAQKIQAQTIHDELVALKSKHILRLDSLHHLEKQVSSLMDLFEIARDFSDCLSFGSMADLLYKKVMPELPFRKMRLSLLKKDETGMLVPERIFTISPDGVSSEEGDLTAEESETLSRRGSRYEMVKKNDAWIFPLPVEEEVSAICQVVGADPSDLAKYEV